ncbi:hypothetical protein DRJ17_05850 [Candidatus Woesearchaeota archaeon]|nr:MAG: hypothetical protein DRJ17_05850 [Candidatus Woesearchaeota archaeon]
MTIGAMPKSREHHRAAVRAGLHRRPAVAVAALPVRLNHVDRSMPFDVAGEVEHQAVLLAPGDPHPPPGDLDIETGGLGGAQNRQQVDAGMV